MTTKIYYWGEVPNWGDRLSLDLVRHFARPYPCWTDIELADGIVIGSILEQVPPGWAGVVAGAGRMREGSPLNLSDAHILGLRGPLSAVGVRGDYVLGDPGLLADELVTVVTRDRALGLLPHWSDTELAHRGEFKQYNPLIISPFGNPLDVVAAIGRCQKLVTSSLHGVIVADAFGIPVRFEKSPRLLPIEGGMFKLRDYSASVGMKFEIGVTRVAHRGRVEDRKHELWDMFRTMGAIM